jgi:hypothetical protein
MIASHAALVHRWLKMSARVRLWLLWGLSLVVIAACWAFFFHLWSDVYWHDERYSLVAIDALDQMNLSFNDDGYFSQLVAPTVYSIGANEKYIVIKQHPGKGNSGVIDRSITHYFIVGRTLSDNLEDRQKGVSGPFTRDEFEKLKLRLSLPEFSKTFPELE